MAKDSLLHSGQGFAALSRCGKVCARLYPMNRGRAVRPAETQGDKNGTAAWYWLRSTRANTVGDVNLTAAVSETGTWRCYAPRFNDGGVRPALPEEPRQGSAPGRNAG